MALAAVIASFIILMTCYVHYRQHFHLVICSLRPGFFGKSSVDVIAALYRTGRSPTRRCCSLMPRDDETFDLFPQAFWLYLCLQYILALLVLAVEIVNYVSKETRESILELVLGNPLRTHHRESLRHIHDLDSLYTSDEISVAGVAIDYVLIYGLLIACLFESFFSFYRYRSTLVTAATLSDETVSVILRRYSVYAVAFALLFVLTVHWHYLVCIPLVVLYMTFNLYCTYKFCAILIARFRFMLQSDSSVQYTVNAKILGSIYFLRRSSLSCCVMQCVSLAVFLFTFNVNAIYFLPVLWAVSSLVFSFNFIRNRGYLERQYMQCSRAFAAVCVCKGTSSTLKRTTAATATAGGGSADAEHKQSNEHGHDKQMETEMAPPTLQQNGSNSPNFMLPAASPGSGKRKRKYTNSSSALSKGDSLRGAHTVQAMANRFAPLTLSPVPSAVEPLPVLRETESEKLRADSRRNPMNVLQQMKQQKQSRSVNALGLGLGLSDPRNEALETSHSSFESDDVVDETRRRVLPALQPAKSDPVSVSKLPVFGGHGGGRHGLLGIAGQQRQRHTHFNAFPATTKISLAPSPIRTKQHGRPKAFDLLGITPSNSPLKSRVNFSLRRQSNESSSGSPPSPRATKPLPILNMQSSFTKLAKGFMRSDSAPPDNKRYLNMYGAATNGKDNAVDGATEAADGNDAFSLHDLDEDIAVGNAIDKAFQKRHDAPKLQHAKSNSMPMEAAACLEVQQAMEHFDRLQNLGFINQQSLRSMQELSLYHIKEAQKQHAKPRLESIDWDQEARPSFGSGMSTPTPAPCTAPEIAPSLNIPVENSQPSKRISFFGFQFSRSNTSRT